MIHDLDKFVERRMKDILDHRKPEIPEVLSDLMAIYRELTNQAKKWVRVCAPPGAPGLLIRRSDDSPG
jgi:hypothetical protein